MQRSYPSQAIKAAAAEGTQFIISLETRSDSSQPDRCGQAISFATSAGQLLAAYLQQGIASCPCARRLPAVYHSADDNAIPAAAAKAGIHAVRLTCGFTTNYFDSILLSTHRSSFIAAVAKAAFKFLTNNPIRGVRK